MPMEIFRTALENITSSHDNIQWAGRECRCDHRQPISCHFFLSPHFTDAHKSSTKTHVYEFCNVSKLCFKTLIKCRMHGLIVIRFSYMEVVSTRIFLKHEIFHFIYICIHHQILLMRKTMKNMSCHLSPLEIFVTNPQPGWHFELKE